jgi:hypothetical protein
MRMSSGVTAPLVAAIPWHDLKNQNGKQEEVVDGISDTVHHRSRDFAGAQELKNPARIRTDS